MLKRCRSLPACYMIALLPWMLACRPGSSRLSRMERRVDSLAVAVTAMEAIIRGGNVAAPPETLTVDARPGIALGDSAAPVTLVEFTDFQCPFCGRHARETFPALKKEYVDRHLVRYVVRNYPLSIHPFSRQAAIAAHCAAAQGLPQYWRYHDSLFAARGTMSDSLFPRLAREMGFDMGRFTACTSSPDAAAALEADLSAAQATGFRGTPSFVIGRTRPDGTVRGVVIDGAYPMARFEAVIRGALARPDSMVAVKR